MTPRLPGGGREGGRKRKERMKADEPEHIKRLPLVKRTSESRPPSLCQNCPISRGKDDGRHFATGKWENIRIFQVGTWSSVTFIVDFKYLWLVSASFSSTRYLEIMQCRLRLRLPPPCGHELFDANRKDDINGNRASRATADILS